MIWKIPDDKKIYYLPYSCSNECDTLWCARSRTLAPSPWSQPPWNWYVDVVMFADRSRPIDTDSTWVQSIFGCNRLLRSYIRETVVQQNKRSCLYECCWTCSGRSWAPPNWETCHHWPIADILQVDDPSNWQNASSVSVLGCDPLNPTYERRLSNRINHISANASERAWVAAERLRIGKAVVLRRWLISFRSATHWIGGMLIFLEFMNHARKVCYWRWGGFGMACTTLTAIWVTQPHVDMWFAPEMDSDLDTDSCVHSWPSSFFFVSAHHRHDDQHGALGNHSRFL